MLLYILSGVSSALALTTIVVFIRGIKIKKQLQEASIKLEFALNEEEGLNLNIKALQVAQDELLVKKTQAQTKLTSLEEQLEKSENDRKINAKEKEALIEEKK